MSPKIPAFLLLAILVTGCSARTDLPVAEVPAGVPESDSKKETAPYPSGEWDPPAGFDSLPPEVREHIDDLRAKRLAEGREEGPPIVFLDCEHYLTRVETEDFCSEDIPPDWKPFEFDGQTYFVKPLAQAGPAQRR